VIGLTRAEGRIYEIAKAFTAANGCSPDRLDIIAAERLTNSNTSRVCRQIESLVEKGFIKLGPFNAKSLIVLIPQEPTHHRVMRDVCASNSVEPSEVTGRCQSMVLVRCRRLIARELQRMGYSYTAIGFVLHRHASSIYDYFDPARTQYRSGRRAIALYGERAAS